MLLPPLPPRPTPPHSGFRYSLSLGKNSGHWAGELRLDHLHHHPITATLSASQVPSYNSHWYICLKEALHATFYPDLHVTLSKGKSDSTTEMVLILRTFSHDGLHFPWPKKQNKQTKTRKPQTMVCHVVDVCFTSENLMVVFKDFQKLNLTANTLNGGR